MQRRNFLRAAGLSALAVTFQKQLLAEAGKNKNIKPIVGSWFEFQHHSQVEGTPWNKTLEKWTAAQWTAKIKEMADAGMRYLALLDTAIYGKSFYPSVLLPQHQLGCEDPLEVALTAADKYGIRFFISNGFYGNWLKPYELMQDKEVHELRLKAMNELAEKYSHHKSFYGWYYPNETGINGHYDQFFIDYVNTSSAEAARLTPKAKTLIGPYGTRRVKADDKFVRQLEQLNVDFIAYQDEIGVEKTKVEESAAFYEQLHRVHKKAAKARLWADVEMFRFEGDVYKSALLPAPPERVIKQLEAVSPYVEKILIYQYGGLINQTGTEVYAGSDGSVQLYEELVKHGYLKGI